MSNSETKNIIQISGLEKTYVTDSERLTILKDLDLTVEAGSKIVIAGESGSGAEYVPSMFVVQGESVSTLPIMNMPHMRY